MAYYRVTYRMEQPGEFEGTVFVVHREISRYTEQDAYAWLVQNKAEWTGKKVISVERVD